jgi:hypothetical protein
MHSHPAYSFRACNTAYIAFSAFLPIGISASALLWLFRLRAIYGGSRVVTSVFGFLWLAVTGLSITIEIGVALAGSPECLVVGAKSSLGALIMHDRLVFLALLTVYDTLVFLAISTRLVSNFTETQQTPWKQVKALLSGSNLPVIRRALEQA